ncbi:hypothetical protein [uncultured Bdellovibrio sp.]|uniref:hypothetical protein n=1 Tax=Bdellovibrio sp. HCB-162 TaxID=3394234 RepID=UPI0025DC6D1A|nr:hypothetical protein [uncultured Bdellovibrio sp.]
MKSLMPFLFIMAIIGCQNSGSATSADFVAPREYMGDPGDFIGNWEGPCLVEESIICKAEMRVNMVQNQFFIQVGYSIGKSFFSTVFEPRRISKNALIDPETSIQTGAIDKDGFYLTREHVGKIIVELKSAGAIALSIIQEEKSKTTRITGTIKRISPRPCDAFGCLGEN